MADVQLKIVLVGLIALVPHANGQSTLALLRSNHTPPDAQKAFRHIPHKPFVGWGCDVNEENCAQRSLQGYDVVIQKADDGSNLLADGTQTRMLSDVPKVSELHADYGAIDSSLTEPTIGVDERLAGRIRLGKGTLLTLRDPNGPWSFKAIGGSTFGKTQYLSQRAIFVSSKFSTDEDYVQIKLTGHGDNPNVGPFMVPIDPTNKEVVIVISNQPDEREWLEKVCGLPYFSHFQMLYDFSTEPTKKNKLPIPWNFNVSEIDCDAELSQIGTGAVYCPLVQYP